MVALGNRNLAEISKVARVPAYDRAALTPGIAHFGVGLPAVKSRIRDGLIRLRLNLGT